MKYNALVPISIFRVILNNEITDKYQFIFSMSPCIQNGASYNSIIIVIIITSFVFLLKKG